MPERGFDTGFWTDPFIRRLGPKGKLLFSYLWTNDHCNQAGVYQLDIETIAFETKLPEEELPGLIESLAPKIIWYKDKDIVWVKNFIRHQSKSPKFLIAVAKCLKKLNDGKLASEVVDYNVAQYSISIPYQYSIDSISIPPDSDSNSVPVSDLIPVSKPGSLSSASLLSLSEGKIATNEKIFQLLVDKYNYAFGKSPDSRATAQLRDLSIELWNAGGVTEKQVHEAYKEAATRETTKWKVSYVRAVLLDWLGIKRNRSP